MKVAALGALTIALLLAACEGNEDSSGERLERFLDLYETFITVYCECGASASTACDSARFECTRRVTRRHADVLAPKLECGIEAYEDLIACSEAAECNASTLSNCYDLGTPEARCGSLAGQADRRIQNDLAAECGLPGFACDAGTCP
jgi:hypothetical protein